MDKTIKKKVGILRKSNLFTYNTNLGRIVEQQSILLTLTGHKPVSRITGNEWVNTPTGQKSAPLNHDEIRGLFSTLGLKCSIKDFDCGTTVVISLDETLIKKCVNNASEGVEGELFGYPKTAVEAFGNNNLMMNLQDQNAIINFEGLSEWMPNFRFSKLHFKEELEVLRGWYNTLKQYDFIE